MAATNDDSDERALRAHIHEIMFDYAMEHLTTDYVQFTNDAVSEVCLCFQHRITIHVSSCSQRLCRSSPYTTKMPSDFR